MCIIIIPHTAVFSIRTEVIRTTSQNNGSRNTSDEQFLPSCIPARAHKYGHATSIREQPLHTTRDVGVAIPGSWIANSSYSNIRERDDLSSVVSASVLIGCCQSNWMPLIIDALIPNLYLLHLYRSRFHNSWLSLFRLSEIQSPRYVGGCLVWQIAS